MQQQNNTHFHNSPIHAHLCHPHHDRLTNRYERSDGWKHCHDSTKEKKPCEYEMQQQNNTHFLNSPIHAHLAHPHHDRLANRYERSDGWKHMIHHGDKLKGGPSQI
jgi:uncharacterized protein YlaI